MARGSKPGERRGGRKKGVPNKRTQEQVVAVEQGGLTPLEFLTSVYREECPPEIKAEILDKGLEVPVIVKLMGWYDRRIEAAKAAAPYVHAKLVAVHETHGRKKSFAEWLADQNAESPEGG